MNARAIIRESIQRFMADRDYFAAEKWTLDSLTEKLWRTFEPQLTGGEYSYDGAQYGPFTDADRQFIARHKRGPRRSPVIAAS